MPHMKRKKKIFFTKSNQNQSATTSILHGYLLEDPKSKNLQNIKENLQFFIGNKPKSVQMKMCIFIEIIFF